MAYPGRYEVGQLSPFDEQLLALTQVIRSSKETDGIDVIAAHGLKRTVRALIRKIQFALGLGRIRVEIISLKQYSRCNDGVGDGLSDGLEDGSTVGAFEKIFDGANVGLLLGKELGAVIGSEVGPELGEDDGFGCLWS